MAWQSLGTIQLKDEWSSPPLTAVNCETFRLIHYTVIDMFNSCFITQYFPLPESGGRVAPWLRVFPSDEPTIIRLPIPKDFRDKDILTFDIQAKWRLPYAPTSWLIEVQALV